MEKLGNTPFVWGDLKIQMEDSIFVPMSALNQIRRDALTKLQEELLKPYRRSLTGKLPSALTDSQKSIFHSPGISVSCEDRDTAQALLKTGGFQGMYLPFDLMEFFLDKGVQSRDFHVSCPALYYQRSDARYSAGEDTRLACKGDERIPGT